MGDGTFSMADGLGIKAVDSIELRRKQKNSVEHYGISVVVEQNPLSLSPNSAKNLSQSRKIHPGQPNRSSSSQFDPTHKPFDLCPGAIPPSVLSSIPSNNPRPGTQQLYISGDFKSEPFLGNANQATSSSGYGPFSPKTAKPPSPSRKLLQVFEEALVREAEERTAELVNTKFDHQQVKVQLSNPNSQILFNARGNPYEKGDPSLGYSMEDNMPRRPHLESDPSQNVPAHRFTSNLNQKSSLREPSVPSQTHQINPKLNNGQVKSKPRNWASLLQSQNPSLDMKLEFFPDLQRGKEATVEIDIALTEVGKWNRYLVGHFLDGSMAYPLLAATARNQ